MGTPKSIPNRLRTGRWILLAILCISALFLIIWFWPSPAKTPDTIPYSVELPDELPPPHLGYGINIRDVSLVEELVDPLGLDWVRLWDEYASIPDEALPYNTLYTLTCNQFVNNPAGWQPFITQMATLGQGKIQAWEICNEVNVTGFWNNNPPNPAQYTDFLCEANTIIKNIDPNAVVVSAGLAPVGRIPDNDCGPGNDCNAMDERTYLQAMIDAGAADCMDAFGYHPYGFAYAPETDPDLVSNGFTFRGAEKMHDILVDNGYPDIPIWVTEFNWLRAASSDGYSCDNDDTYRNNFKWQEVSESLQADYLTRAYTYADAYWPWMEVMFMWNTDWHTYKPEHPCLHSRFYSLRRNDGTSLGAATPAYDAVMAMEKRSADILGPKLSITPSDVTFLTQAGSAQTFSSTVTITNTGTGDFIWFANLWAGDIPNTTLTPSSGYTYTPLIINIDSTGYAPGTYTQVVGINTFPMDVLNAPGTITITLEVTDEMNQVYFPQVIQNMHPLEVNVEPHGPSKIGTHAIAEGGTLELVNSVAAAGGHVAVVKGLSFGYLCQVKQISPETVTVGRWADPVYEAITAEGDPVAKAQQWMNVHMAHWEGYGDCVDYWEMLNEVDPPSTAGHVWLGEFFIAAMDIAEQNGYRLALFSYSLGVPEMWEWRAIADTGVFARAQSGGHILSLHEYSWPGQTMDYGWGEPLPQYEGQDPQDPSIPRYPDRGNLTGRYRHLYRDILIPRGEVIPLVITELNLAIDDPVLRDPVFVEQMAWYDDRLREDDYVIGMTIFTLGGAPGWSHFDYHSHLPDLAARIIALKDQ